MTAYATRADLYRYGFARGSFTNPGRTIASANASTEVLELDDHGFETDTPILFRAEAGGSLPAPLVAGTTYYAIRLTDATFSVSLTEGGAAIDLTTAGSRIVVATTLPVDETLERYSRWVDGFIPAHLVPFESPYPVEVVAIVAELSGAKLRHLQGDRSQPVLDLEAAAAKQLTRWAKGIPLRDAAATAPANLAVAGSASNDSRGWDNGGFLP